MTTRTKKIHVCIVINDFLVGGAQRLTADIVQRLDRTRFAVTLITLFQFADRDSMYDLLPHDCRFDRLSFSGAGDLASWARLYKVLRAEKPDVVISNLFFSNTATRMLAPLIGYRCIAVEHNTYIRKPHWHQLIDRILATWTYAIIAVSPSVRTFTAAQEHIAPGKFRVIRNGINISAFQARDTSDSSALKHSLGLDLKRKYVITVGRLTPQKNLPLLIEGYALFRIKHPEYDLLIVGGGGLEQALQEQIRTRLLTDHIHLLGSRKNVAPLYHASDFFVSTSTIEGFGLAHAEALACGLPLVSTKTAGPDEMIEEGKNGFFIKETPEDVARGLAHMVSAQPDTMRERARQTAQRYDIENTVHAYENLIVEGRASRG